MEESNHNSEQKEAPEERQYTEEELEQFKKEQEERNAIINQFAIDVEQCNTDRYSDREIALLSVSLVIKVFANLSMAQEQLMASHHATNNAMNNLVENVVGMNRAQRREVSKIIRP